MVHAGRANLMSFILIPNEGEDIQVNAWNWRPTKNSSDRSGGCAFCYLIGLAMLDSIAGGDLHTT
jgi:hypothetical protein